MRNKGKAVVFEQSVRTIKSTDSKKINPYKNKVITFEDKSAHSHEE